MKERFQGYIRLKSALQTQDGELYGEPDEQYDPVVYNFTRFNVNGDEYKRYCCGKCKAVIYTSEKEQIIPFVFKRCPNCESKMIPCFSEFEDHTVSGLLDD